MNAHGGMRSSPQPKPQSLMAGHRGPMLPRLNAFNDFTTEGSSKVSRLLVEQGTVHLPVMADQGATRHHESSGSCCSCAWCNTLPTALRGQRNTFQFIVDLDDGGNGYLKARISVDENKALRRSRSNASTSLTSWTWDLAMSPDWAYTLPCRGQGRCGSALNVKTQKMLKKIESQPQ